MKDNLQNNGRSSASILPGPTWEVRVPVQVDRAAVVP